MGSAPRDRDPRTIIIIISMGFLYNQIFYRPIFNILVWFYEAASFHDLGIAIILTTILVRLILYPFFHKGAKQQMLMQRIQPHVKKIQEQHKGDMQKQSEALMALYKEHGVNPFSSFLLLIIQLPIMLAFYWVVSSGITVAQLSANLYPFIHTPGAVNTLFLGVINLSKPDWIILAFAALAQFLQARIAIWKSPDGQTSQAQKIAQQMSFIAPLMTLLIFYALPAAVALYWLTSSVFSVIQQYFVNKHLRTKYGN